MKRILTGLVLIFSVLGLIISGYSLAAHYDTNLYEVCTVNETFDCSSVNASEYSVIFGVPVAFLGIIGYAVIAILLLIFLIRKSIQVLQWSVAISVGALLFSFYLSGIEAFVLYKWCLFCVASQVSITIITGAV